MGVQVGRGGGGGGERRFAFHLAARCQRHQASAVGLRVLHERTAVDWLWCLVGWLVVGGCWWLLVENDAYTQMETQTHGTQKKRFKFTTANCHHIR